MNVFPLDSGASVGSAHEWDEIAVQRDELIKSGNDYSLQYVLLPCIVNEIDALDKKTIIDCGCGTGTLTKIVASHAETMVGIDISSKSIEIAKKFESASNLQYVNTSIEEYSQINSSTATLCVSNMVLMNTGNLNEIIDSIYKLLIPGGSFVFTISHPCYWPIYWDYFNADWFNYHTETAISADFRTSLSDNLGISTHIHRPIDRYINVLVDTGFSLQKFTEPYPVNLPTPNLGYEYHYPRFLCITAQK